ncbi:MAG: YopX family protein [Thermacetogeniaceae bacterium]
MFSKYRVWDSTNKKMLYYDEQPGFKARSELVAKSTPDLQFMPCSGYQDKEEKDIYEGDVLKTNTTSKALVVWVDNEFDLRWLRCEWPTEMNVRTRRKITDEVNSPKSMTVIGNKFQNPDLLGNANVIYCDEQHAIFEVNK